MAVPAFQDFLLPVLQVTADGQEHAVSEFVELMAQHFNLSPEDRAEMLPSGTQTRLFNRCQWARTYLAKAGLFEATRRGHVRITQRGRDVLAQNIDKITREYLEQFEEFRAFTQRPQPEESQGNNELLSTQTPEERLESSYQALRKELAGELLKQVMSCSPAFFERLVIDLLVAMGYGGSRADAGRAVGQSGDGGIDGIIKEDRLGLDVVYLQAKRWQNPVGGREIRDFVGSLALRSANKGVFITTSYFTAQAIEHAGKAPQKVVLIDGQQLVDLLIDFDVGVSPSSTYVVKKLDLDYFGED